MRKVIFLLGLAIFLFQATSSYAVQKQETMTTYYPAPYGEYTNLTASDSVGVGTTTPIAPLQVIGNAAYLVGAIRADIGDGLLSFVASGTDSNFQVVHDGTHFVKFHNTSVANDAGAGFQFTDGSNSITPIVTITNAGNVGIGTETPTSKLQVMQSSRAAATSGITTYGPSKTGVTNPYVAISVTDTPGGATIGAIMVCQ